MILLLPHGNADPERGFSVKKILEKHGNNIDEDTLESVITVKDFLIQSGCQSGIEVRKRRFSSVILVGQNTRSNYKKKEHRKRRKAKTK